MLKFNGAIIQVHMLSVVPDWHCISDDCMDLTFNQTYLNKSIVSEKLFEKHKYFLSSLKLD